MLARRPLAAVATLALAAGCGPGESGGPAIQSLSPNARPEIVEMLRGDLEAERHPSDGGGRSWLSRGPRSVQAGARHHWRLTYEAGPLGIAEGGMLFFQAPPFWGWSTPQTLSRERDGFTRVTTTAPGVTLEPENFGQQLLGVRIGGRALNAGEEVFFDYGVGPAAARADRYAESASRFLFAVDGDGDGVRKLVAGGPTITVTAGPATRLAVTLPSTARPGATVRLTVALLDAVGNAAPCGWAAAGGAELDEAADGSDAAFAGEASASFDRQIRLTGPAELGLPRTIRLTHQECGRRDVELTIAGPGVHRIHADAGDGLTAVSNPLRVSADRPPVLWADLHGHSGLSDGTGTPGDYLQYAREVAALDVVALTDHDHWGLRPLSRSPDLWDTIRRATASGHRPGRFVILLGFEWTSWLHGHRHVLFFGDEGEVLSSVDPAYETPDRLWDALRGRPALTFAHHSAGAPIATNWDFAPDPELEPVTEITSVHGSSEADDGPRPVAGGLAGNWVRDALGRGYRLGFIGSGDSHDGHPGLAHLASPNGGLAALVGAERSRESVLETLRARRVYATNGPRILLEASFDGRPMGATVAGLSAPAGGELWVRVAGTAPIERVDLVRSGRVVESIAGDGAEIELRRELTRLARGEYVYARVVQVDGGAAWSSPFFFE